MSIENNLIIIFSGVIIILKRKFITWFHLVYLSAVVVVIVVVPFDRFQCAVATVFVHTEKSSKSQCRVLMAAITTLGLFELLPSY